MSPGPLGHQSFALNTRPRLLAAIVTIFLIQYIIATVVKTFLINYRIATFVEMFLINYIIATVVEMFYRPKSVLLCKTFSCWQQNVVETFF